METGCIPQSSRFLYGQVLNTPQYTTPLTINFHYLAYYKPRSNETRQLNHKPMPSLAEQIIRSLEEQRNRFLPAEENAAPDPVQTGKQAHSVTIPMKLADGLTHDVGFFRTDITTDITQLINKRAVD